MTGIRMGVLGALAAVAMTMAAMPIGSADAADVQSLRGATPLTEVTPAAETRKQNTGHKFTRAFRQQPPLIPHKVDKYQIDMKVNQCLRCHDWPYNVEENAPKVSETHYKDRQGKHLDSVSPSRWFCNQCHVPQVHARTPVVNTFQSAFR